MFCAGIRINYVINNTGDKRQRRQGNKQKTGKTGRKG